MKELTIFKAVCEGDVEVIVRALQSKEEEQRKYGHVFQDILVLATDFQVYNFTHVKHLGNSIAHFLARRSKSNNEL